MSLHDILPPIELRDYTFIYILFGLFLVILSTLLYKHFFKKVKKDAKYYLNILEKCDFKDAKKTALQFSYYGKYIFIDEVRKARFLELTESLKPYKYIENLTSTPQKLENDIKKLLEQERESYG